MEFHRLVEGRWFQRASGTNCSRDILAQCRAQCERKAAVVDASLRPAAHGMARGGTERAGRLERTSSEKLAFSDDHGNG